jgi:dynein intermediate chain
VQRSKAPVPAFKGHSEPIFSLRFVGTQHAHHLTSAAADGKIYAWDCHNLSSPVEEVILTRGKEPFAATCLDVPAGDINGCLVGGEDGAVVRAITKALREQQLGIIDTYEGHEGFITAVSCHPSDIGGSIDFGDLVLSASVDWTVKLWSPKLSHSALHSIECYNDHVTTVKWHPRHPAIFACADGEGHLDLWNLNRDVDQPSYRITGKPVTAAAWSGDGKFLGAGEPKGLIQVFQADDEVVMPGPDAGSRMESTVTELRK